MQPTRYCTVENVRCPVYEAGDARRDEAVVFVHGNPGPMDDWEPMAERVAAFARVVAMDLPGFGRADKPKGFSYSIESYAAYLSALLRSLGVRRVHLVAHDFGGLWGVAWAMQEPSALCSLTLIDSPVSTEFKWHFWGRAWNLPVVGELIQASVWNGLIQWVMNRDNPRPLPRAFTERVVRLSDRRQKFVVLDIYRQSRVPARDFAPLVEGLARLDPPTCVVWGERDPYAPPRVARSIMQRLSRARLHLIADAGHWPFIDEPEAVADLVCSFLREHYGAQSSLLPLLAARALRDSGG